MHAGRRSVGHRGCQPGLFPAGSLLGPGVLLLLVEPWRELLECCLQEAHAQLEQGDVIKHGDCAGMELQKDCYSAAKHVFVHSRTAAWHACKVCSQGRIRAYNAASRHRTITSIMISTRSARHCFEATVDQPAAAAQWDSKVINARDRVAAGCRRRGRRGTTTEHATHLLLAGLCGLL